jgi:hypothetical protein
MAAYAQTRDATAPEPVQRAWTRATEHWDDAAEHDELFRLIVGNNCYAWGAGRYRMRADDPIAVRQLERLRRAAEATLLTSAATRSDPATRRYRTAAGVLALLVVVIVAGLLYAGRIHRARRAAPAFRTPDAPVPAPGGTPFVEHK